MNVYIVIIIVNHRVMGVYSTLRKAKAVAEGYNREGHPAVVYEFEVNTEKELEDNEPQDEG